jgi:hypothetical protein
MSSGLFPTCQRCLAAKRNRDAWSRSFAASNFSDGAVRSREHAAPEKTLIMRANFACGQPDASRGYSEDIDLK